MRTASSRLNGSLGKVAGGEFPMPKEAISRLLEQPPEPAMGDYALPCFRFAKDAGSSVGKRLSFCRGRNYFS